MDQLTALASVVTDASNTIAQAEQRIVNTLRELAQAGCALEIYDSHGEDVTVAVYPKRRARSPENAIVTVDLHNNYCDQLEQFCDTAY